MVSMLPELEVLLSEDLQAQSLEPHSQHLAWVHEAFGIQYSLELLHGLHTHGTHLLLQQMPLAQTNAVLPCACSMESQCSPEGGRGFSVGGPSSMLPMHTPHPTPTPTKRLC